MVPLAFVVLLGIIKEAIGEIVRWKEDRAFNSTQMPSILFELGKLCTKDKRLDRIYVGDILEIKEDDQVPADCVILWSSDAKGKAYIQTA